MHDPFDRRISFGGVALVRGRLKKHFSAWKSIELALDHLLRSNDCFDKAPFLWIGLTYRYGIKNDLKLEFKRIDKKYGDLDVLLELDMEILLWADKNNLDLLHDIFMIAALEALIQIGRKYKLSHTDLFISERAKYGNIPDTTEECENYCRIGKSEMRPTFF